MDDSISWITWISIIGAQITVVGAMILYSMDTPPENINKEVLTAYENPTKSKEIG